MKQNWEYKKLGDVCDFINGFAFKSDKFRECGLPVLRISNIKNDIIDENGMVFFSLSDYRENFDNYEVLPGDIVIAMSGATTGKIGIHIGQKKYYLNQRVGKFVIKDHSIDNRFLFYYLKTISLKIFNDAMGVAQPNISSNQIKNYDIPVPPLAVQQRIVAELDLLTGIIDKQNAQLKELDNLAQAIFYDMFGDPIENPKGWEVKKLGDVSTSVSYGTSSPSSTVGKYKYLRMNNITYEGFLDLTDLKYIDMDDAEFEKYSVREGDVLFNRTNSMDLIGKTTYIHNMEPMIIAGYIIRVRLVDSVLPVYVSKFMNMPAMKKKLKGMAKGAVNQANINSKELKSIDIPLPPLALQQSFADKIQSIENQKAKIKTSIADTQKLLDYTMDKYFG